MFIFLSLYYAVCCSTELLLRIVLKKYCGATKIYENYTYGYQQFPWFKTRLFDQFMVSFRRVSVPLWTQEVEATGRTGSETVEDRRQRTQLHWTKLGK